ncbi:MAG: acetate--CoA ligase family protein [Chloroflexi bacterium]|nr:acetate--CoA ligase family protein [Chloroflexota bacterium]
MNPIQYFFRPHGVALIGASSNPEKLSYGVLENMSRYGYEGGIYPVNPKGGDILGFNTYADISLTPDPVDLAVIMIPAPLVPATLEACGKRGLKAATIISGGFREVGEEGAELERQCLQIARQYNMRLIGPNCVGTVDLYSGMNTTFIRGLPEKGNIGFISQSGAMCGAVIDLVKETGIGFTHFVSMGNEMDVDETDMIDFLNDDPHVKVIAAYIEAIRNGERFIQVARRVGRQKPIVMLKAGRSEAGEKAVSSHTGSLAGTYTAYQTAFKQAGVIEARSAQELFDIAVALANQPLPAGKRALIVTNAGGPTALASDSIADSGYRLANLHEETKQALRKRLNPAAQVSNPIDMLGSANPEEYAMGIEAGIHDENIDVILPVNVPTSLVNPEDIADSIADAVEKTNKTVLVCLMGSSSIQEARRILHRRHIPIYTSPEQLGPVLAAMDRYKDWLAQPEEPQPVLSGIETKTARAYFNSASSEKFWGESTVRPLLETYGIPLIPGAAAKTPDEAVTTASKLGYPVVMKVISPDILHKSDAGGIRLNLKSMEEIKNGFESIMESCHGYKKDARIEGVLVEKMAAKGTEIIIGMRRDPQFGPLMMFGLGGIYVELFTDIAFRITPLNRSTARQMILETRAGALLTGLRGQTPADVDAVVDILLRLAQISIDFPDISEIEINPLLVYEKGKGALALDARAILKSEESHIS